MVFIVTRFVPGGPIERIIAQAQQMPSLQGGGGAGAAPEQNQPLSEEQINELKKYYGFDKPVLVSYFQWLGKVLTGDLGTSTRYYDPVWDMVKSRIPISLFFGILTLVLVYSICVPLGITKAIRHKSNFDNISSFIVFAGYAVPGWVVGVFMLGIFASHWEIFPLGDLVGDDFEDLSFFASLTEASKPSLRPSSSD